MAAVLGQTPPAVEHTRDAGVHDAVVHIVAITPGPENALVDQAAKLIRHGLRGHSEGLSEVGNAQLAPTGQRVKEAKARRIRQDLEQAGQAGGLLGPNQRAHSKRRLEVT